MRRSCSEGFRSKSSIKRVVLEDGARHPYPRDGVADDQVLIDGPMCHADEKLMTLAGRLPVGACLCISSIHFSTACLVTPLTAQSSHWGSAQFCDCERRWAIVLRASPTARDRYSSTRSRVGIFGDSARS